MKHPGKQLKAVVFDLDGTLVDTAGDFIPAVQQLLEENGREVMDPARITRSVSNGSRALVKLALGLDEAQPGFEAQRQRLLNLYGTQLGRHSRPYAGISLLLATFERRGIAWGISTNKPRAYAIPLLSALNIDCQSTVCPDDVSAAKPDPECLFKNCDELNCDPQRVIYIGDHLRDIEAGRSAGMYTIAAAYGYIEDGDDPGIWRADSVAHSSEDLHNLIFPASSELEAASQ
ncbi:MAG: HAD-IA family hydrolase [Pseudomonadota bacterium]